MMKTLRPQAKVSAGKPVQGADSPGLRSNDAQAPVDTNGDILPYFATPHDTVLSAMHDRQGKLPVAVNHPFSSKAEANTTDENTSPRINRSANASPTAFVLQDSTFHREVLTDPYDGTTLGISVLNLPFSVDHTAHLQTSRDNNEATAKERCENEELWTQLSRITDLQTEIARMHLDMEGVGVGKGKAKMGEKKDRRQRKSGEGSRQSQSDAGLEEYDVEEGVDDEETERNRARQEEFAKLADQFEGRKESINNIMAKLDDLTKALTEFHTLQAPEIKMPSSRKDSNDTAQAMPGL